MADIRDWDIFGDLMRITEGLERPSSAPRGSEAAGTAPWAPRVDIHEHDDALVLVLDLPGMRREDIDLQVDADGLTVQGSRGHTEGMRSLRLERPSGPFRRSFRIGVPIHPDKAQATYREGVLEITIPKATSGQAARVRVRVE